MGGDDLQFDEWYRRDRDRTVAWLWALSGDRALAEEAWAEACARALVRWGRVGKMERPQAWVATVALNVLRRAQRRRDMERTVLRRIAPAAPSAYDDELPNEALWAAVRRLPPRQRQAVTLRYIADLTEGDVASVMGVRRGTVASCLSAARAALAAQIDDQEVRHG